jgi:hypothetical protein
MDRPAFEDEPSGPIRSHHTDWDSWPTKGPDDLEDGGNKMIKEISTMVLTLNGMRMTDIFDFIQRNKSKINNDDKLELFSNILEQSGCDRDKRKFIRLIVNSVLEDRHSYHNLLKMAIYINTKMPLKGEVTDSRLTSYFWVNGKEFKVKEDIDLFKGILQAISCDAKLMGLIAEAVEHFYVRLPASATLGTETLAYPNMCHRISGSLVSHSLNTALHVLEGAITSLEMRHASGVNS